MAKQLTLVTGKGGVGKTTVAIGLAEAIARTRGAAHLVQVEASGPPPEHATRHVLDPRECIVAVAGELLGSTRLARFVAEREAVRPLLDAAEAIRAFAVLEQIRALMNDAPVVLDMPATGHALAWLRSVSLLRRVARRGSAHDMAERLEAVLFASGRAEAWAVTLPEPFVLRETKTLRDELGTLLTTRLVVNRLPPPVPEEAASDEPAIARALARQRREQAAALALGAPFLSLPPLDPTPASIAAELRRAA